MPYIAPEQRAILDGKIQDLVDGLEAAAIDWNPGAVNYIFTKLIVGYVERYGLCYKTLQSVDGLLASVGSEFERRVVEPYEMQKRIDNGDVYSELMASLRALAGKGDADGG